nr:hypothetical protein Q903MT_gene1460 [Picea sitchensis]
MQIWSANLYEVYLHMIMHARLYVNAKCYLLMHACVKCQSRMLFAMVSTKGFYLLGTWLNKIDSNERTKSFTCKYFIKRQGLST